MKARAEIISDFYHQLALLVQSRFPLPDCLRRLAQCLSGSDIRKVIEEIQKRVTSGEKLADVMAD